MRIKKNILKLAALYVGTIIGAGFATGREIVSYFIIYGQNWVWAMVFAGILFVVGGGATIYIAFEKGARSCGEFLECVFGKKIGGALDVVTNIFVVVLFLAMTSASGSVVNEVVPIGEFNATLLFVIACGVVFAFGVKGVVFINTILSPFIIFGGAVIGVFLIYAESTMVMAQSAPMVASVLAYVSYNSITAVSVLTNSTELVEKKSDAFMASFLGGGAICLMGLCMGVILHSNFQMVSGLQVPIFYVVSKHGDLLLKIYCVVILAAIFTTAIGNGYSWIAYCKNGLRLGKKYSVGFLCLMGVLSYFIEFSFFVDKGYRFFGYIGVFEMIGIICVFLIRKINNN